MTTPARRCRQGWALSTDDRAGPRARFSGKRSSVKCTPEMLQRNVESLRAWEPRMSHLVLGRAWCSCGSRLGCCQGRPALRRRSIRSGPARRRPAPAGPASVGSEDVPLSSRHPGALGVRLDRPLDADVRDRRHGAARDRVQDGADAHRRLAAQRPRPPGVHADVAGESRGLHAGGDGRGDRATRPGHGRAGPDPGASSGARQRPAAVPRIAARRGRPAEVSARSRPSGAQPQPHGSSTRSCIPRGPLPASTPTPRPNSTPSARCNGQKPRSAKNSAPLPGKLSTRLTNIRPSCARQPAPTRKPTTSHGRPTVDQRSRPALSTDTGVINENHRLSRCVTC